MTIYTCDPNVEIPGRSAHSLLESINRDNYLSILEKHGLAEINETVWYRLQDLLNVLNEMYDRGGAMMDFVSIGMATGANSVLPKEVDGLSLTEFLFAYSQYYLNMHRNGFAGEIRVEALDTNHIALTLVDVPYPDDMMYGLFYSYARRFARGLGFRVAYDDALHHRDLGGDSTVIHITW